MNQMSQEAQAAGLTPEILESILNDHRGRSPGLFKTKRLAYRTITIKCPLWDEQSDVVPHPKGKLKGKP